MVAQRYSFRCRCVNSKAISQAATLFVSLKRLFTHATGEPARLTAVSSGVRVEGRRLAFSVAADDIRSCRHRGSASAKSLRSSKVDGAIQQFQVAGNPVQDVSRSPTVFSCHKSMSANDMGRCTENEC
jgi:hypothetical protein